MFFFFQAEDGIRDLYVTGVQTCALPIYKIFFRQVYPAEIIIDVHDDYDLGRVYLPEEDLIRYGVAAADFGRGDATLGKIGRASCRGRVWMAGVAEARQEREGREEGRDCC